MSEEMTPEVEEIQNISENISHKKSSHKENIQINDDRPVPEKFWDQDTECIDVDRLLESYLQLEKKLNTTSDASQTDISDSTLHPDEPFVPECYSANLKNKDIELIPEIDERLRAAKLSQEQAELVYELAEEYIAPQIAGYDQLVKANIERSRLESHFGSQDRWHAISDELTQWGAANLDSSVYETLSQSFDGVLAMHNMMTSSEPDTVGRPDGDTDLLSEEDVYRMMRDPRYWRDHNPEFVDQVTQGFKKLYGE